MVSVQEVWGAFFQKSRDFWDIIKIGFYKIMRYLFLIEHTEGYYAVEYGFLKVFDYLIVELSPEVSVKLRCLL